MLNAVTSKAATTALFTFIFCNNHYSEGSLHNSLLYASVG